MEIIDQEEYFKKFNSLKKGKKSKLIKRALNIAVDTRKFEIELYWKRATYFWAFIVAAATGFVSVITSNHLESKGFSILLSLIGLLFSIGWYFVNRGSKFWQENWEAHLDLLGERIHGPLFKTIRISRSNFLDLNKEYPFSVSKVNQLLSFVIIFFWIMAFLYSIFYSFDKMSYFKFFDDVSDSAFIIIFTTLIAFVALIFILFKSCSESFVVRSLKKAGKKSRDNYEFLSMD